MGAKHGTVAERFWPKVAKAGKDECWLWTASISSNGYGCLRVAGVTRTSHTLAWELANGRPVPSGLCICHTCDVPACCNPSHLFVGTYSDNARDMVAKGRYVPNGLRGEAHPNARLSDAQVLDIRASRAGGITVRALADRFAVSYQQVWNIVNDKARKAVAS